MNKATPTQLAWMTAVLWLTLVSLLTWQVFASDYSEFLHEDAPDINTMPSFQVSEVTFVHYLDERCSCHRFALPHVNEIEKSYPDVKHVRLDSDSLAQSARQTYEKWGISSPSVSIINRDGSILYHGPYTDGAVCGQGEDIIQRQMQRKELGDASKQLNLLSYGCYCNWQTSN